MNRTKILLIILLIVAVILLGLFWYLSSTKQREEVVIENISPPDVNQPADLDNEEVTTEPEPKLTIPQVSEEEKLQAQLVKMASAFAERYGSYSNQSDFENLEDLLQFMSNSLKLKTERFIADKRFEGVETAIYYGMTTKVLNNKSVDFSSSLGRATFNFSTQRQEVMGSSANANVFYQDVEIKLIKEAGVWKINNIEWL